MTPSPGPQITDATAWIAEACSAYGGFRGAAKAIGNAVLAPPDSPLDEMRESHLARLEQVLPLYDSLRARLSALPTLASLEALHAGLLVWARDAEGLDLAFQATVRGVASVEALQSAHAKWDADGTRLTFELYDSVGALPVDSRAGLAAYEGDCEELPLEAAGFPLPREMPDFDEVAIEESFDEIPVWYTDTFQGGRAEEVDGAYRVTVTDAAGSGWWVNTELTHQPGSFADVRVETVVSASGPADEFTTADAGLICRDSGEGAAYVVVLRAYGVDRSGGVVLLVWKKNPDYALVARRTLRSVDMRQVPLGLTCLGGEDGSPVTLAVDIDGHRMLEWVDEAPLAPEGFVGMLASSTSPASFTFEEIRVRVP